MVWSEKSSLEPFGWLGELEELVHAVSMLVDTFTALHEDKPKWFLVIHITSLNLTPFYDVGALGLG